MVINMNNLVIELKSTIGNEYYISEAFKSLRTNIQFCGNNFKCIALTSCMPNEGKSVISVELALSFAEIGKKVLLIDADMRKSIMHTRYNFQPLCDGLSQYLTGQADLNDIICGTQNDNLFMIPCGLFPPNPVELLAGENFKTMVNNLREHFDYIIIDTPPLGAVIDSAVISTVCDGVAMVIALDKVSRKIALDVKNQLERSGCKIIGVIANFTDGENKKYTSYGKYSRGKYQYEPYKTINNTTNSEIKTDTQNNKAKINQNSKKAK